MKSERRIAYAALDIGTSQLKIGVYDPSVSNKIVVVDSEANELIYGNSGEVRADYKSIRDKSYSLFKKLGNYCKQHHVETLYVGICGHISSLLEWSRTKGSAKQNEFPTWLDTSCYESLDEYRSMMGNGKSIDIIGTFLPAGTNWLLTKLLHKRKSGFSHDSLFLQVSDAIFYELCGDYKTHFSSQLSMVDLRKRGYAKELLQHLQLDESSFPEIDSSACPVSQSAKELFDFPTETFVFPAMADLYTSLYGLRLEDKQGFMLANTSEQAGVFYLAKPTALDNFLHITFGPGFINYGSTNTGGNIVNWFIKSVLRKNVSPAVLNDLTAQAVAVELANTPIILPYLQGERAPIWNSQLTACMLELNSFHTDAHLFRAILESIAFARRHCFEELGMDDLTLIKLGGGSSKNNLWNFIRANVLKKPIAVADEKELSLAGMIDYLMETTKSEFDKPAIDFVITYPDPKLIKGYDDKYKKFIHYQKLLHST